MMVDVFFEAINRWESFKIIDVVKDASSNQKSIRVGSKNLNLIEVNSENLAKFRSRTGRHSNRCPFPNGVENALRIAKEYVDTNIEKMKGLQIYEELADRRLLSSTKCLELFYSIDNFYEVGGNSNLNDVRYKDVKAALLFEAAVDAQDREGDESTTLVRSTLGSSSFRKNNLDTVSFASLKPSSEEDTNIDDSISEELIPQQSLDELCNDIFSTSDISPILKYYEPFCIAIDMDDWKSLRNDYKQLLELADNLESMALRSSWHHRYLLFTEFSRLVDKVANKCRNNDTRRICRWRLGRHYVNGFGVDVSDLNTRDSADLQAADFYTNGRTNHYIQCQVGILGSLA